MTSRDRHPTTTHHDPTEPHATLPATTEQDQDGPTADPRAAPDRSLARERAHARTRDPLDRADLIRRIRKGMRELEARERLDDIRTGRRPRFPRTAAEVAAFLGEEPS